MNPIKTHDKWWNSMNHCWNSITPKPPDFPQSFGRLAWCRKTSCLPMSWQIWPLATAAARGALRGSSWRFRWFGEYQSHPAGTMESSVWKKSEYLYPGIFGAFVSNALFILKCFLIPSVSNVTGRTRPPNTASPALGLRIIWRSGDPQWLDYGPFFWIQGYNL